MRPIKMAVELNANKILSVPGVQVVAIRWVSIPAV